MKFLGKSRSIALRSVWLRDPASAKWLVAILAAMAILVLPTVLNGFPYIFPDSPEYLDNGYAWGHDAVSFLKAQDSNITQKSVPAPCAGEASCGNPFYLRPFGYSLFLLPFATHWTVYLVPVAQAVITLLVLLYFLYACGLTLSPAQFLFPVVLLAIGSSLPAHVNHVMPDLFAGDLILYACAAIATWPRKGKLFKAIDLAVMSFVACMHLTFIPLLVLVAVFAALGLLIWRNSEFRLSSILVVSLTPAVLAAVALCSVNFYYSKVFTISLSSPVFLQARLIDAGPELRFLEKTCGSKKYLVCGYLDRIAVPPGLQSDYSVADHFLWAPDGVRRTLKDSIAFVNQAKEINQKTIEQYPFGVLWGFLKGGFTQLLHFNIDAVHKGHPSETARIEAGRLGALRAPFEASSQYKTMIRGRWFQYGTPWALQLAVFFISVFVVLAFFVRGQPAGAARDRLPFLAYMALAGVFSNAMLAGALSTVHDRYHSRTVWIVPLLAVCILISRWGVIKDFYRRARRL